MLLGFAFAAVVVSGVIALFSADDRRARRKRPRRPDTDVHNDILAVYAGY